MKRSLFSLALVCLAAAAAVPATAQINTNTIQNFDFGPFNLAEAYPCAPAAYAPTATGASLGITPLQVFNGTGTNCAVASNDTTSTTPGSLPGAAPGVLSLNRAGGLALNINCFAVTPAGQFGCVVQAYRLYKMVPGSFKCPDVYGQPHFVPDSSGNLVLQPYIYTQFGSGIRTWWPLNFTQPGTKFLLQVVSACQFQPTETIQVQATDPVTGALLFNPTTGAPILVSKVVNVPGASQQTALHMDSWRWRVVADANTLLNVINLMHNGAVSTLEVPCILGEDMYDALKSAQHQLAVDTGVINNPRTPAAALSVVGNDIFNMEALIVANCLFVEVLNPLVAFPGPTQFNAPNVQPPGNAAQTVSFGSQGSAVAGIIDTIEHPCCCKLLVDLEWISISQGIIGQTPTLPVF